MILVFVFKHSAAFQYSIDYVSVNMHCSQMNNISNLGEVFTHRSLYSLQQ